MCFFKSKAIKDHYFSKAIYYKRNAQPGLEIVGRNSILNAKKKIQSKDELGKVRLSIRKSNPTKQ